MNKHIHDTGQIERALNRLATVTGLTNTATIAFSSNGALKAWLAMALNGDENDREWVRERINALNID